jgi:dTDP-4-dehydrorhamnose reductase
VRRKTDGMRILVTGAGGQLGRAIARRAGEAMTVIGLTRRELDISDPACGDVILAARPDVVVNTAAMTHVDGCEHDVDAAYRINALGARHVALATERAGAALVQVSTDYVFGGDAGRRQPYWEFDQPTPLSVYGASKLAGEDLARAACRRCYVVRTAWLYGLGGAGFVPRMLDLAERGEPLSVVDNEFGNPTFCDDLADGLLALLAYRSWGTYHLVNEGWCSRYEFAGEILRQAGYGEHPITPVDHFPRAAQPPAFGALRNFAAAELGVTLPDWRTGLATFFARRSQVQPEATTPSPSTR